MAGSAKEAAVGGKDRPLYEIVRDQLIEEIRSGAYPAGSLLPSVREITVNWTVSTTTARKVLAELVSAGYARSEGTRGHVSTGGQPAAATPSMAATREAGAGVLTVRARQTIPAGGVLDGPVTAVDVRVEPAPPEVALALLLPAPDVPVIVRRRLAVDAHGVPSQYRTSYILKDLAEGTPLAAKEPIDIPWLDAVAQYTGLPVWRADGHVAARHPTDTEAAALALAPMACVLVRTECTVGDKDDPIDYTITVWPGESARLKLD